MKIIECPRDAMQGIDKFIHTSAKIRYINQLLKVGFDTIDFGSFVSPKAIPQMKDTAEVVSGLDLSGTTSQAPGDCCQHPGRTTSVVISINKLFRVSNVDLRDLSGSQHQ